MIQFFVSGIPRPGGSKKAFPIHTGKFKLNKKGKSVEIVKVVVSDAGGQKNKDWRSSVIEACRSVFTSIPLRVPVKLSVIFYMPYRKGDFRTGKNKNFLKKDAPKIHDKKPDCLKLLRSTEDALTGVLWMDDCQVAQIQAMKIYSLRPGAFIQISLIADTLALPGDPSSLLLP
jgi:Holliday junction resolvase RusA-like endonuclease